MMNRENIYGCHAPKLKPNQSRGHRTDRNDVRSGLYFGDRLCGQEEEGEVRPNRNLDQSRRLSAAHRWTSRRATHHKQFA